MGDRISTTQRLLRLEKAIRQLLAAEKAYMADDGQMYPTGVLDVIDRVVRPLMGQKAVQG